MGGAWCDAEHFGDSGDCAVPLVERAQSSWGGAAFGWRFSVEAVACKPRVCRLARDSRLFGDGGHAGASRELARNPGPVANQLGGHKGRV